VPKRKSFQDTIEEYKLIEQIGIGDLVSLDPEYKKYHYPSGSAPLYRWSIGLNGHITKGTFSWESTAVVLDIRFYVVEHRVKLRSYKLMVDNGAIGWFCAGGEHLIKQN
jgi:hypothetical protein